MVQSVETCVVYILFTRSSTYFSRLIYCLTGDDFTHVSIGFEGPFGKFYSFGRKYPPHVLPAGLIEERIYPENRRYPGETPCRICTLRVSPQAYRQLQGQMEAMLSDRGQYRYNLLGTMSNLVHLPLQRKHHYFCSQFVSGLLMECGAIQMDKPPGLIRPSDLYDCAQLNTLYQGPTCRCPKQPGALRFSQVES